MGRTQVLDHGYVALCETWGHGGDPSEDREAGIVSAARQSTQGSFRGWDRDEKLLRFLYEHKHSTPFEFAGMTIEVQAPIFVFREWQRHRTQCLAPGTLVHFEAPKSKKGRRFVYKMTIEDVWRKWQPTVRASRPERQTNALFPRARMQAMLLRCLNEETGEFVHTRITDVIRGEPKEMVRVKTTSGRSLVATREHRVFTSAGWMTLGDAIESRAQVATEGNSRGKLKGWRPPPVDEAKERWRPVSGWELYYEVSDFGRVRTIGRKAKALSISATGYPVVSLNRPGEQRTATVHTLVLEAFVSKRKPGHEARHLNHNRTDARLSNLAWGTSADNSSDMSEADRQQRLSVCYEDIVEVTPAGMLPTFDLSVEGPWHNFVGDGFVVHNSYNEMSARYEPIPDVHYLPTVERIMMNANDGNKQAGTTQGALPISAVMAEHYREALDAQYKTFQHEYEWALSVGVPKELARLGMPVGRYSRMRASANLRNWLAFLTLRLDPSAQWEIREFAKAVGEIVAKEFPRTWALFQEGGT